MTTIAFDGKHLAADKQTTFGTTPIPSCKIEKGKWKGKACYFGASGLVKEHGPIIDALKTGKELPPDGDDEKDFSVILVTKDLDVYYFGGGSYPVFVGHGTKFAIGSGGDYALGAMYAGKSAKESVEIACQLDVNSGCGVDVVRISK